MKEKIIMISLIALFCMLSLVVAEGNLNFYINEEGATTPIYGTIYYFYNEKCPHCERIENEFDKLRDEDFFKKVGLIYKDISEADNFVKKYDIKFVPTLILIKEGDYYKKVGYATSEEIENWVLNPKGPTPEPNVTACKTGWQCINDYEAVYYNQDCTILPEHENCEVGWKCSDGKCLKEEEEIPEEEPEPAEIEHPVCNEEILGKSYCENKRTMMVCSVVEIDGLEKTRKVYNWIPTSCEYICKNDFCINEEDSPEPEPEERGFRYAYWQCYDGVEEKQGGESSCKPSEIWQKYAREFCEGHCYPDGSKCGVNSFSVNQDCYLSSEEPKVPEEPTEEPEFPDEISVCKNSCPLEDKCYPFGYRKSGEYCSDEGKFVNQLESDGSCENNFECESNVCVSGRCVSSSLIEKIIGWFKRLFG